MRFFYIYVCLCFHATKVNKYDDMGWTVSGTLNANVNNGFYTEEQFDWVISNVREYCRKENYFPTVPELSSKSKTPLQTVRAILCAQQKHMYECVNALLPAEYCDDSPIEAIDKLISLSYGNDATSEIAWQAWVYNKLGREARHEWY